MALAVDSGRYAGRRPAAPSRKPGTWKMAYADFLTALMAFFLLLWLVSGVPPETRAAIAAEFTGRPPQGLADISPATETSALMAALSMSEPLLAAADSVVVTAEGDGIRVELIDTASRPLFERGETGLTAQGAALAAAAGAALANFSFDVTIEGHTDAFPATGAIRSNWDLSAARANAARQTMEAAGLPPARLRSVVGYADTRPLDPGQPHSARNRRISLKIHTAPAAD